MPSKHNCKHNFRHYAVLLKWIGYGPGDQCPSFWEHYEDPDSPFWPNAPFGTGRYHTMRIGLDVGIGPFGGEAVSYAQSVWHPHEAVVVDVIEIDILMRPKKAWS